MVERIRKKRKKKDIHGWPLRTGLLFYEFISLILLLFLRRIVLCGCWRKLATIQRLRTRNILIRNFFFKKSYPPPNFLVSLIYCWKCSWNFSSQTVNLISFLSVFHWVVCLNKKVQGKSMLSPLLDSFGKSVGCWHQQRAASSPSKNGVMGGGGEKKIRRMAFGWPDADGRTPFYRHRSLSAPLASNHLRRLVSCRLTQTAFAFQFFLWYFMTSPLTRKPGKDLHIYY